MKSVRPIGRGCPARRLATDTRRKREENGAALCDRCSEEITLANDLDKAGDIDRRRQIVMVASTPRRLTATHWLIFALLYRHRGDVVYADRIRAELSNGEEQPSADLIREHMRRLRQVLAGARYRIENYRGLGYELIIARRRHGPIHDGVAAGAGAGGSHVASAPTAAHSRSPPCRPCGCRIPSKQAARANPGRSSRNRSARPFRPDRAQPGGGNPSTTRSTARGRRGRYPESSADPVRTSPAPSRRYCSRRSIHLQRR
jgi:DNA-binding winged helix-turn-helix (wHTH) protein